MDFDGANDICERDREIDTETIRTARLLLRPFRESDYDDLFEFLSQLRDDEFEGYPGITCENGNPIWKDTYVYANLDTDRRK